MTFQYDDGGRLTSISTEKTEKNETKDGKIETKKSKTILSIQNMKVTERNGRPGLVRINSHFNLGNFPMNTMKQNL